MSARSSRNAAVAPEKQKERRGHSSIPAVDPADGSLWEVLVSDEKMDRTALRGMMYAKELAYSVREVLVTPRVIFQGVREDGGEDDWLCYVGVPRHAFTKEGKAILPYKGEVFLVFVNGDRVAYHWGWEESDGNDPGLPPDHETRFTKKVL